jgi:hypothetical protein
MLVAQIGLRDGPDQREVPFGRLRASSRSAGKNAELRDDLNRLRGRESRNNALDTRVTSAADLPDENFAKIIEEFSCIVGNFP